jgi:hypothetical protein
LQNYPNVYKIKTYANRFPECYLHYLPKNYEVEFTCAPGQEHTLPAPEYLEAHYIVFEILHASDMGGVIYRQILDAERRGVLQEDGSTNVFGLIATSLL